MVFDASSSPHAHGQICSPLTCGASLFLHSLPLQARSLANCNAVFYLHVVKYGRRRDGGGRGRHRARQEVGRSRARHQLRPYVNFTTVPDLGTWQVGLPSPEPLIKAGLQHRSVPPQLRFDLCRE